MALVTVAVIAALFVPAASAGKPRQTASVNLALLPLQKAQIGITNANPPLPLAHDSGPVTNAAAARMSFTGSPGTFKDLGRVGGYTLDYGHAFSGCTCMTRIQTSVEQYRTAADAKRGLAFWKRDDTQVVRLNVESGFDVDSHRFLGHAGHAGASRFKYFVEYNAFSFGAAQIVDERFADGRYVGEAEIWSGTEIPGTTLVTQLATKLDKRLHGALDGRLHAKAVKLLKLKAGPPPGGPDLSTLVLHAADLAPGEADLGFQSYFVDPLALSDYQLGFEPAGRYFSLSQEIEWYRSASEAGFRSAYDEAVEAATFADVEADVTRVDLSSIRWGEQGTLVSAPGISVAIVALAGGRATDLVVAASQTPIQPSDVQDLAQSMATRLGAGLPG